MSFMVYKTLQNKKFLSITIQKNQDYFLNHIININNLYYFSFN